MDRRLIGFLIALIALAVFFWWLPEPEAPEPDQWPALDGNSFLLRDVRVFDGDELHESFDVLVVDGMIKAVSGRVPQPDGVPELGASGMTLLPGFMDAHTHNFGDSREQALRFGVTTQVDMFTAHTSLTAARAQRESMERTSLADMWSAGTLVTAPSGHGTQFGMDIPTLTSAADAPAFVAERVAEGSDFIKIVVESGAGWSGGIPTLDAATVAAVVAAAHSHGKLAVAHVGSADEARIAIEAGADGLVHVFHDPMPQELKDTIVASGAFVVPTLAVLESLAGRPNGLNDDARVEPYLDAVQADGLLRQFPAGDRGQVLENAFASTRALHEAGVRILAGSDAPNPGTAHGASLHRELELLVEAGLTPVEALHAATRAVTETFPIPERGRIARGMRADLVLVAGDPTADITATRDIVAVWKNGYRVARPRTDDAPELELPAAEPVLGTFDDGADGWHPTTDTMMGGSSTVELSVADGRLVLDADVKRDAPFPWAGAIRMLGGDAMEPTDASAYTTLAITARGDSTVQLLLFSGPSAQATPIVLPLKLEPEWQETLVDLTAVPGLDRGRLRAVSIAAGPAPGPARIELDAVVLR